MAYCRYGRVCRHVKLRISMIRTFSFGNISHRGSIIVERIFLVQWKVSILTNILPNILKIVFIVIGIW